MSERGDSASRFFDSAATPKDAQDSEAAARFFESEMNNGSAAAAAAAAATTRMSASPAPPPPADDALRQRRGGGQSTAASVSSHDGFAATARNSDAAPRAGQPTSPPVGPAPQRASSNVSAPASASGRGYGGGGGGGGGASGASDIESLWACCAHPSSCFESVICCPCQVQRQLGALEPEAADPGARTNAPFPLYAASWFLVVPAIRHEVRLRLAAFAAASAPDGDGGARAAAAAAAAAAGEAGSGYACFVDVAAGALCPVLSLAQTYRQLAFIGTSPSGWFVEPYLPVVPGAAVMH